MTTHTSQHPATLWDVGDYSAVGVRIASMAEELCETAGIRGGMRVLDVGTGNGNLALCAARRDCDVIGVDLATSLLDRARARTDAEGLSVDYRWGNAERLEFDDDSFDAVISCVGVQFAGDQPAAAREMMRVCRPGGFVAMANWSPNDLWTELPMLMAGYAPPPPGAPSMMTWGTADGLRSLFGLDATIDVSPRTFRYHFATAERYADLMMATFPPFVAVADAMDADARSAFHADLTALADRWNDGDGHLDLPLTYVIALVRPAG